MKDQYLNKYHLLSVHMVSADHYTLRITGGLYHKNGKSYPPEMFSGGCVFIYHAIGCMIIKHQLDIKANETVKKNHF